MMTAPVVMAPAHLVVAVTPDRSNVGPVAWAAREAVRRRARLVVTALPPTDSRGSGFRRAMGAALAEGLDLARELEPGLEVRIDHAGSAGYRHVVGLSEQADLLVLATAADEPQQPLPAAPLPERLAVHAGCPVVVLSPVAVQAGTGGHRIVVGWDRGRSGRHALDVAASEAASRSAWLTVVSVPPPVDPEVERTLGAPDHESGLLAAIAEVERAHPRLVVDLLHRKGPVGTELIKAAQGAELLVVGCHHSEQPWSNRPGAVAGSLLRTAPCPLMLVGAAGPPHRPHPVAEPVRTRATPHTTPAEPS